MGSNDNGLQQSPWASPPVPTHDASSGDQGIGGGLDAGAGPSGLRQSPWASPPVPTPSNMDESGPFGNPSRYAVVDGSTRRGETLADDITQPPMHTVDKR